MVGITTYPELGDLPNAVNDAKAIVQSLKGHNVKEEDIIDVYNCHSFAMNDAFHEFVARCNKGDLAFLFFSGHGCAFKNQQCLLARALDENARKTLNDSLYQTIEQSSLKVDWILAKLREKGVDQHLLLLDCCREFQMKDRPRNAGKADPWENVKPAPFNVTLGPGTTIGYATAPGDYALEPTKKSHTCRGETGHGEDFQLDLSPTTTTHAFVHIPFHGPLTRMTPP